MKMTSSEFATLLIQVANLYIVNPELPVPVWGMELNYSSYDLSKEEMQIVAKSFPRVEKQYTDHDMKIEHKFFARAKREDEREWKVPQVSLTFACTREEVCIKKVVGKKLIPERVIEAYIQPAREEEIVEWECKPLMK